MNPSGIVTVALKRATTMAKAPITIRAIVCGGSLHTVGTRNKRVTTINDSLLQKLEVFSEDNATVSFGNRLTLSIFKFFTGQTDKQTN